jgi:2-methylcitrate dehydratase
VDSITKSLVDFSTAVHVDDLPSEVVDEVRRRLIDSFGCALVGFDSSPVTSLRKLAQIRGVSDGCLVWGTEMRTTPEVATLINATAVRFLDFNDHTLGGHPSDNIAAVIAACESSDGTIDDLIAGVLVNYEVFGELGRLLVRNDGWDHGTTGVVASACATGRALGLTAEEMSNAIGIATISNISTRKSRRGQLSMWKGVATPYAAQCGLIAAHMAGAGVTGPHDAFEGEDGFFQQVQGPFTIEELGDPSNPKHIFRANYKYWPVEFNAQLSVWLGKEIREQVTPDDIKSIEVETYYWTWHEIGQEPEKWSPKTRETADHSLPYTLAVSVMHGGVGLEHFTAEALADPAHKVMMDKISVQPADDITEMFPQKYLMRARVTTTSGKVLDLEVAEPRGRFTNPMSDDDLRQKYRRLLGHSSLPDEGEQLLNLLENLPNVGSMGALLAPLQRSASPD